MSANNRIYGLDAARAVLLIGGPITHAVLSHDYATNELLLLQEGSHLFRMATFFMISGFITALVLKGDRNIWIANRFRQLFVPLVTTSVVMMIIRTWIIPLYTDHSFLNDSYPGSLWFLIALITISPLTLLFRDTILGVKIVMLFTQRPWCLVMVATLVCLVLRVEAVVVGDFMKTHSFQRGNGVIYTLLVLTPNAALFYSLGTILAQNKSLLDAINKNSLIVLGYGAWAAAMALYYIADGYAITHTNHTYQQYAFLGLEEVVCVMMSMAVFLTALRIKNVPVLLMNFSQASYSIYLFHGIVIALAAYPLLDLFGNQSPYALYTTLLVSSLVLSYTFHQLIKNSNIMMFLFNGKKLNWHPLESSKLYYSK